MTTAADADLSGAEDAEHLAFATAQRRVLVTRDADFLRLHAAGQNHCGIIYFPQRSQPVGRVVRGVMRICAMASEEQMRNHVALKGG